jgi:uncharacterized protein YecE (DUF72 family)
VIVKRAERKVAASLYLEVTEMTKVTIQEGELDRTMVWVTVYQKPLKEGTFQSPISFHITLDEFRELCRVMAQFADEIAPEVREECEEEPFLVSPY